ncbi:dipeptide epimerase [Dysgonomonas sp. GY617]|nr:dipeptide epimerase [Dysgonomonas sp. GY617]
MNRIQLSYSPYNLILKYPFTISTYSRTTTPVVLVEIHYNGYVGYGEASLPQYLGETQDSVISFLKQVDLGQFSDLTAIDEILTYVDHIAIGNTAAKASIDIALHDLVGKMAGKAWHEIWNLNPENTPNTTYTIGIDTDDIVKKKTTEVSSDFKILKVKLGGNDDKRMIEVIRSVTDLPLAIDANQGWKDRSEALEMVHWLKEQGVVLIEQPMLKTDLEGSAWLTAHSPLPIFADESVQRLADMEKIKGAFSGINIKLMKCTGMNEAYKMINIAPSMGFDVMLGCMTETSCAISAASQLSPAVNFADLDGALLITNDCFRGTTIKNGKIILNNLPGIGVNKV